MSDYNLSSLWKIRSVGIPPTVLQSDKCLFVYLPDSTLRAADECFPVSDMTYHCRKITRVMLRSRHIVQTVSRAAERRKPLLPESDLYFQIRDIVKF